MKSIMSKLKNGLKIKLYILVTIFLSLMIINFSIIRFLINDKKADSTGINLTSRQSVLVQKYIKNFFFFMETKKIQDVTQVVQEFEGNAKILLHGATPTPLKTQPAPPTDGEEVVILYEVDKTLAPHVVKELESISAKWLELKSLAIKLLSVSPEEKTKGYEMIVVFGEKLSLQIDDLVAHHQKTSDSKFDSIIHAQVIIIFISFLTTIIMMVYFDRTFLKRVFQSFNNIENFTSVLSEKSDSIHNSSSVVSNNSKDLATSIEETMAAVTELTEITRMNEENTERSRISSNACSTQAKEGKDVVNNLLASIQKINETNSRLSTQIEQGNQEFKKILDLVNGISSETSIINDIVFQTKLLSFNASVEAARAGESGKGFSVVAEEVGNLAVMSGNSSNKIAAILNSSKKTIEEIIEINATRTKDIIKECQIRVNDGIELAKICGSSFENIHQDVNKVDNIIIQLASSSKEQTTGIELINKSMLNISAACRDNNSSAKNMQETIEVMVENTQNFQTHIGSFSRLLLGAKGNEVSHEAEVIDFNHRKGA